MTRPESYNINNNNEIIVYGGMTFDFSGIKFPIETIGFRNFKKNNLNFSINIYEIEKIFIAGEIIFDPTINTKDRKRNNIYGTDTVVQNLMHYANITNLNTLCSSQFSKGKSGGYFCENCLQCYHVKSTTCSQLECGNAFSWYPTPDTTYFKGYHKKLSPPVVIYADIEAVLENYKTCLNSSATSSTTQVQNHLALSLYAHKYYHILNEMSTYEGK